MNSAQKVIKILAIVFAIFLIVNIFSAVIFGVRIFSEIIYSNKQATNNSNSEYKIEEIEKLETLRENAKIKIDLSMTNLEIKQADVFQIEKRNISSQLKCKVTGNTLEIKENNTKWFNHIDEKATIIVYIPKHMTLQTLDVSMGVGVAEIQGIRTNKLDIDSGAGKMTLINVTSKKTNIDGGAGNLIIDDSILEDLSLDCGVGVTEIKADIVGNSKISCGVGKTKLILTQSKENYTIQTETGLGSMMLNGEKCSDDGNYGSGDNMIKIDGGVGSVEITTK